jgi:thymidylate synthase (FAD)
MRILSEPEIYVIGRQTLDQAEVQRFLEDHETSWQTDSEIGAELIVEIAGRTCFDAETEVLTDQGWKYFANLDQTEKVLTLNPATHFVEFQSPLAYQAYHYDGLLKAIDGRDVSFAVTPDHRQYGRFAHKHEDVFVQTDEVGRDEFRIHSAGDGWIGRCPDAVIMDGVSSEQRLSNQYGTYGGVAIAARPRVITETAQLRALALLLTYYVTEGSLRYFSGSGQGITIYGGHVDAIKELCAQLDYPISTYIDPRNGVPRMSVGGGATLRRYCEEQCGKGSHVKHLPTWVLNLPTEDLARIWDVLVMTDGHDYVHSGREVLITTSHVLAGQAQEILCKLGYASSINHESDGVNHRVYRISRKQSRSIVLNKNAWIEGRQYTGMVYCVSTQNGVIYIRRNGKPHFSGNCYMSFGGKQFRKTNADYVGNLINQGHGSVLEHAVWDLLITGVSRSLTHELVRHRAGTGFCLAGDTLIYSERRSKGRRDGAAKRKIADIYAMTQTPHGRSRLKLLRLRCLNEETGLFTTGRVRQVICSGVKPVFRVDLKNGASITCTKEHRFMTQDGWLPLEEVVGGLSVTKNGLAVYGNSDAEIMVNGVPAYKDAAWLREQYVVKNLDQATIADMAGVSSHTIRAWVRKHRMQKPLGSWTKGVPPWNKGKRYKPGWRHSLETRVRLREQKLGTGNPQWHGGITPRPIQIRRGVESLRYKVYERDHHRCQLCGKTGKLTLHHILPVWSRPDLATDIDNLVSVCPPCHLKVNTRELEYVERFGRKLTELGTREPPKARPTMLAPHSCRIIGIAYVGEQMTYDIEMEAPHHNFVANGIVTHNSQLSQRYVDESTADFVEPGIIAGDQALHEIWLRSVQASHQAYNELVDALAQRVEAEHPGLSRTTRKKMAREAARSVLPNATETKLLFSANARALRWIITLRGGEGAEPEIRKLAVKLCQLMQKEAPNLFGDFEIVRLPDGSEGVSAGHVKV